MDREQIIWWAFEADMEGAPANDDCRAPHFVNVIAEELEAFAKLVAAHEREACAQVAENCFEGEGKHKIVIMAVEAAKAIRARGNT